MARQGHCTFLRAEKQANSNVFPTSPSVHGAAKVFLFELD